MDEGYDSKDIRRGLRVRRITPRIAWRDIDDIELSERLGRCRWVVERTLA